MLYKIPHQSDYLSKIPSSCKIDINGYMEHLLKFGGVLLAEVPIHTEARGFEGTSRQTPCVV